MVNGLPAVWTRSTAVHYDGGNYCWIGGLCHCTSPPCMVRVALGSANTRWWGHYCANPHLLDMTSTATQSSTFTHRRSGLCRRSHKTTHTHKQTHVWSISLHKSGLLHGLLAIHKTCAVPRASPAHFSNCLHTGLYNQHTLKRWSCGFTVTILR